MSLRTLVIVGALAALVVISFLLAGRRGPVPSDDDAALQAGYYLTGVVLRTTDEMGREKYRLQAERAEHDPVDGSIALTQLQLDFGQDGRRWTFRADHGQMPASGDTIDLRDNVTARTARDAQAPVTAFATDSLAVDIAGETAATDAPVSITFAQGTLAGVGLDADLANERVSVRSEVTGRFVPPPR
jgi:LPS export ABC transporter protein LptC